jgi:hypothetical protein
MRPLWIKLDWCQDASDFRRDKGLTGACTKQEPYVLWQNSTLNICDKAEVTRCLNCACTVPR